jgi:hypothetical protein
VVNQIDKFVHDQLSVWPAVAAKYRALKSTRTRTLPYGGLVVTLQSNPGRVPIFDHGCPLCEENYLEHQHTLPFEGRKGRKYNILVNRAPIFPNHLVITRDIHTPQTIWHRFPDMLDLAQALEGYLVFYNSPNSGTTVPGHAHFQACPRGYMPLERVAERLLRSAAAGDFSPQEMEALDAVRDARLYHYKRFNRGVFLLRAQTAKSMAKLFYRLLDCMNLMAEETEPRFNAYAWCSEGEFRAFVTLRGAARSRFPLLPGAADMAGFVVIPREEDFDRITPEVLAGIYADVTLSPEEEERLLWRLVRTQPRISAGIAAQKEIRFEIISDGAGQQTVRYREGKIDFNGVLYDELVFEAVTISTLFAEPSFIIYGEDGPARYAGTLRFIVHKGLVQAVNEVGAEDYLLGVLALEAEGKDAGALRRRAVELRSWLLAQCARRQAGKPRSEGPVLDNAPQLVTYLEHRPQAPENHEGPVHSQFDVCAGTHCHRYRGLTERADAAVRAAIDQTWGSVLTEAPAAGNGCA